jgi:hypothetical protein
MRDEPSSIMRRLQTAGLIALAIWALAATVRVGIVPLLRDDLYQGDAAQHVFWTYRFIDPSLFPGDLSALYFSQPHFASMGWRTLFRVGAPWIDPQRLSEWIAILLVVPTLIMSWQIGRQLAGQAGALAATACLIAVGGLELLAGGFARSFALPIVLAGVWCLLTRRVAWFGVVLLVAALFYAPTLLMLGALAVVNLALHVCRDRSLRPAALHAVTARQWVICVVGGVAGVGVIASNYLGPLPDEVGSHYRVDEARAMPEYGKGGRTAFFRPWHIMYFHQSYAGTGLTTREALACGVALAVCGWRWRSSAPPEWWAVLLTSLALFAIAHAVLFYLYLPSRYTLYMLPTFGCMALALVAREWGGRWVPVAVIVAAAIGATTQARQALRDGQRHTMPDGMEQALVWLQTTPTDTVIVAHPDDANHIPLRSRRSAFVNTEVSNAWHRAYYAEVKRRLGVSLQMCFESEWDAIDRLAQDNGIDLMLINQDRSTGAGGIDYFPPLGDDIKPWIRRGAQSGFAISRIPRERIAFESGRIAVVRVGVGQ